ncbi:MAG: hypothetical protein Ct9H300mP27_06890 [Chloroflexota bacterium]|nr:MAG: hypothetical protein Ct9H300mP27_06890 [Chloroflexota bacterium]
MFCIRWGPFKPRSEAGINLVVGQLGDLLAAARISALWFRSLYGHMCIQRLSPPNSVYIPAARGKVSLVQGGLHSNVLSIQVLHLVDSYRCAFHICYLTPDYLPLAS